MNDALTLLQTYKHLNESLQEIECGQDRILSEFHTTAFFELREQLKPYAEDGDIRCQYILACLYGIHSCYTTEEEWKQHYEHDIQEATRWWVAAVKQGHPWALDNLATCGVGPEAERASKAWTEFEKKRPELVGSYRGWPVYGPDFIREFCSDYIGFVATDEEIDY